MIPILVSDGSLGKSTFTVLEPKKEQDEGPLSVFDIAKELNLKQLFICDETFLNFPQAYKNSKKLGIQLIWGIRFLICENVETKSDESLLTESSVRVWMKNGDGYRDLAKLYSAIYGEQNNKYYVQRGDWNILQKFWTNNLIMSIDFYNGFLAKNLLEKGHVQPNFGSIVPFLEISKGGLPFDFLIEKAVRDYAAATSYPVIQTHPIFYNKRENFESYSVCRFIDKKSCRSNPNLDHFSSSEFCVEAFLEKSI